MKNQARACELKCKYNIQGICHVYGECIAKDLFISELEKIKGEIRNQRIINPNFDFNTAGWCIDLIERNIKELKKENKQL